MVPSAESDRSERGGRVRSAVRSGGAISMTTDWDGQGLPPAALARMERGRSSAVRSSLLSVPGHVGVEACGFSVVGEVMGCIVETIGFTGWAGCGYGGYGLAGGGTLFGGYGGGTTTRAGGAGRGWGGLAPAFAAA